VIEMLPLEATGIRFNLPSKLALWFDPTIRRHANALQGNLVLACDLPQQRTARKLTRFADDD
jgi:hypothetical protein